MVEYRWEHQGLEVQAGTWQFRDLSLSVTGKQYVGSRAVEPFVGAGLWAIVAWAEEGTGYGLIGRIPTGFDWDVASRHAVALTIYLNRALALKRPDPENRRPPRKTLVPLPGAQLSLAVRALRERRPAVPPAQPNGSIPTYFRTAAGIEQHDFVRRAHKPQLPQPGDGGGSRPTFGCYENPRRGSHATHPFLHFPIGNRHSPHPPIREAHAG